MGPSIKKVFSSRKLCFFMKSTACDIVNKVCEAVVDALLPSVIKWPEGEALKSVINGFATQWHFLSVVVV